MSTLEWTTEKPTKLGWYWYRRAGSDEVQLIYCGAAWDHLVDFASLDEPITFMTDHLMEGQWAGPLQPPT